MKLKTEPKPKFRVGQIVIIGDEPTSHKIIARECSQHDSYYEWDYKVDGIWWSEESLRATKKKKR